VLCSGLERLGRPRQEEEMLRLSLVSHEKLAREFPTVVRYRNDLLYSQRALGDLLWDAGRRAEATEFYRRHVTEQERATPQDAAGLAEIALFLATCCDPQFRDPRRAVELAKRAEALAPRETRYWYILGVAHYAAGNWRDAIQAIEKSGQSPAGDS